MAKNKTEIHVTTVFDGELDATDVFVSLISQKYGKTNTKEYLAKKKDMGYNEDEVQKSQIPFKFLTLNEGTIAVHHIKILIGMCVNKRSQFSFADMIISGCFLNGKRISTPHRNI